MLTEDELYSELATLVPELGLVMVDCRLQTTRFGIAVQVVVYKPGGIGTDDCAAVHRMVQARLEIQNASKDLRLEVSSPGLDRKLRLPREYPLFIGRGIQIISKDSKEYRGILTGATATTCTVLVQATPVTLGFDQVAKAKLDYTQEGGTPWA